MSTLVLSNRIDVHSAADSALRFATRFWFVAAVIGQWAFLYYIVAFYGTTTVQGDFAAWAKNRMLPKGYVSGDLIGNLTFAAHALLAAVTSFGGALQLVPRIRQRAMAFHRWNGRVFMVTALLVSITGLYMVWFRGTRSSGIVGSLGVSLNGVLIIIFAIIAWRSAIKGDPRRHRVWALRTYLVANGQWFMRIGVFAWLIVNRGPVGMGDDFDGPFVMFWVFACYLLPLAFLELYLHARDSTARTRFAMAGGLIVLTILMSIGIFGVSMLAWRPVLGRL